MTAYAQVARYIFNEASSGTTPTTVADSVGAGNLALTYNALAAWISNASGNGLQSTATPGGSSGPLARVAALTGGFSAFSSKTEASLLLVFRMGYAASADGCVISLAHSAGGDGLIRLTFNADDGLTVAFASEDSSGGTQYYRHAWGYSHLGTTTDHVLQVVFDTTQAVADNRARLWIDGVQINSPYQANIPLNAAIPTIGASHYFKMLNNEPGNNAFQGRIYYAEVGTGQLTAPQVASSYAALLANNDANWQASSAATISAATPSGTIGTSASANIGCTTTNGAPGTNTLYTVRSASNVFSGVTGAQVKAGQRADGATTGVTGLNAAITTTTPSVAQPSLSANTLYYYAIVQEDAGGLSNVLTGSFTTAVATRSVTLQLDASAGVPFVAASKFWTRLTLDGAAVDGGSGGLSGTPAGDGSITLSGLGIAAGAGWVTFKETASDLNSHNYPVTFA